MLKENQIISKKIFVVFILVLFLISMIFFALPGKVYANGTTYYVDGTLGTDYANHGTASGSGAFKTIQHAINDSRVTSGDTIIVAAGTYDLSSPISVNKPLTITGDITTPSNVIINAPTGVADKDCFQVKSSNVTIQGFEIQGAYDADSGSGYQNAGVMIGAHWADTAAIPGLQNINISYNEITNCTRGIYVYRAQNVTISHNKIHDIKISGANAGAAYPGKGIELRGDGDPAATQCKNIDILKNEIYNCELIGIEVNHWEMSPNDTFVNVEVLIDGNIIHNNGGSWQSIYGTALTIYLGISTNGQTTGVTITNNEIYGHKGSTNNGSFYRESGAVRIEDDKEFTICDNYLHDNDNGVVFSRSDYTALSGHVITGNKIYNNEYGISVDNGDVGYAHNNNIEGNTVYGVENLGSTTLDATNNWWGSASGPIHSSNPSGTGDKVSDNVNFTPWLTNPIDYVTPTPTPSAATPTNQVKQTVEAGTSIVDASAVAGASATVTGSGGQTVTIEKIPIETAIEQGFLVEGVATYVDLHLDSAEGVEKIEFTILGGQGIPKYWNGSSWIECSDYTIDSAGNVLVTITNETIPSLTDLTGTIFTVTPAPVRTHAMTCYQVYVNDNNNFEFVFLWEYRNNNWVKIYDMEGNEVFSIDMKYGSANFEADLPNGTYTVKTYHEEGNILQEFVIAK